LPVSKWFSQEFLYAFSSPPVHLYVCPPCATELHCEQSHEYSRKLHCRVQQPVTGFCPASDHDSSDLRDLTFSQPALLEIQVFWEVTPRRLVDSYQRFGGSYCPHLRGLGLLHPEDKGNTIVWNSGNGLPVDVAKHFSRHFNIILPSVHRYPKCPSPFRFPV
jgi:hypothetical protein